jgi:RNA polymerase sigma-70 factor, ECF subfamily
MNAADPLANRSDESLMGSVCDGSAQAFEVLVRRYEKRLFNYLCRMTGNAADADDLFQETFLRVHKHRRRYDRTARFKPWLYQIATNACKDHFKYMNRRRHQSLDARSEEGIAVAERIADPAPGPREAAMFSDTQQLLDAAIAQLPEHYKSVFLMAKYEGLKYDEIADALDIPVGTVKSRMNKAVNDVMAQLKAAQQ